MALTWWKKGLWQICMHHWTLHEKVDFPKILPGTGGVYSTTFHHELRNERFTLISFIGFPTILSTLHPFPICICNRKYSKWTFSNGPHTMEKRFMADLHASLDITWKSRFSQNSTRYLGGVYSTTFDTKLRNEVKKISNPGGGIFHNFSSWIQIWKIYIDIFYRVSCNIKHITSISNLYLQ